MSHVVITCTCREDRLNETSVCPVPGHALVPRPLVDPWDLVAAGDGIAEHLDAAVVELMKARAEWVGRGLPAEGFASSWATWLDVTAREIGFQREAIVRWSLAARKVAQAHHYEQAVS